jgi:hypothetical protein
LARVVAIAGSIGLEWGGGLDGIPLLLRPVLESRGYAVILLAIERRKLVDAIRSLDANF